MFFNDSFFHWMLTNQFITNKSKMFFTQQSELFAWYIFIILAMSPRIILCLWICLKSHRRSCRQAKDNMLTITKQNILNNQTYLHKLSGKIWSLGTPRSISVQQEQPIELAIIVKCYKFTTFVTLHDQRSTIWNRHTTLYQRRECYYKVPPFPVQCPPPWERREQISNLEPCESLYFNKN